MYRGQFNVYIAAIFINIYTYIVLYYHTSHAIYNIYNIYTHLTNLLLYTYTLMYPCVYTSYYLLSNSTLAFYGL